MDILTDLFRIVRHEQKALKKLEKLRKTPVQVNPLPTRKYDFSDWRKGQIICLFHVDTNESLGTFQEYLHPKNGRRLIRIPDQAALCTEFVRGKHWISPTPAPLKQDDIQETIAIHRRFLELMQDYL
jgi:hypothetical protein